MASKRKNPYHMVEKQPIGQAWQLMTSTPALWIVRSGKRRLMLWLMAPHDRDGHGIEEEEEFV